MSKNLMTAEEQDLSKKAVLKAVRKIGGQRCLARLLHLSHPTIQAWCSGTKPLPLWRAIQIERLMFGEISIGELRPDLKRCGIEKMYRSA